MSESAVATESRIRHKTFTYRTGLRWMGGRAGVLGSEGKPEFRVASPPEFRGEAGVWTPEDLFVAAVNVCTMATFLAFAHKSGLALTSYTSEAEGTLEFLEGGYRFTKVSVRPEVVVAEPAAVAQAEKVLEDAHKACLISNSIRSEVLLEPVIRASSETHVGEER